MVETERRNPAELLAAVQREDARGRRGRLRIFFGASAGVGKTYSMLEAARVTRAGGADIVVGLDSGLTHLAGALGRTTIGIYADYDPALAPVTGAGFTASLGGKGTPPSRAQVLAAVGQALPAPAQAPC